MRSQPRNSSSSSNSQQPRRHQKPHHQQQQHGAQKQTQFAFTVSAAPQSAQHQQRSVTPLGTGSDPARLGSSTSARARLQSDPVSAGSGVSSRPEGQGFRMKGPFGGPRGSRVRPLPPLEPLKDCHRIEPNERLFLEAAERGDKQTVLRCLQGPKPVNVNCTNILGRSAIQVDGQPRPYIR